MLNLPEEEDREMTQLDYQFTDPNLRTGVIICQCGGEISNRIDTSLLQKKANAMAGVVYSATDSFPCSKSGRTRIEQAVHEKDLDRVLIVGCTPRTVEKLFKQCARACGLNANCIEVTDIREQCAYVHELQGDDAIEKAVDLVAMGIGRLQAISGAQTNTTEIVQSVLINGAGLQALALSRSLTRMGIQVIWASPLEKEDASILSLDVSASNLLKEQAKMLDADPLFTPYLEARIIEVNGHPGDYEVILLQQQKKHRVKVGAMALISPGLQDHQVFSLATLLHLPISGEGRVENTRRRLRPERYHGNGIFVMTNADAPYKTSAALLQVYQTAARVKHFLMQKNFSVEVPVSVVDPDRCTGCGNCVQHCPVEAIYLLKRESVLSLAEVDPFLCMGCGNCVVACPARAITIPGLEDEAILEQINAILMSQKEFNQKKKTKIIMFGCEWGAYAAADLAGKHHLTYAPEIHLIRMNCSARFDPMHVLWAFLNGADGVILGACPPGECHYNESNLRAYERVKLLKQQLAENGIDPRRLHLAFLPGDDGPGFVREVNEFACTLKEKVF